MIEFTWPGGVSWRIDGSKVPSDDPIAFARGFLHGVTHQPTPPGDAEASVAGWKFGQRVLRREVPLPGWASGPLPDYDPALLATRAKALNRMLNLRAVGVPWVPKDLAAIEPPWPIPNLPKHPSGWEVVDQFLVDVSDVGQEDEPAMTQRAFKERLRLEVALGVGLGYAITDAGQWQVRMASYRKLA